jgi:hypothetical protein
LATSGEFQYKDIAHEYEGKERKINTKHINKGRM